MRGSWPRRHPWWTALATALGIVLGVTVLLWRPGASDGADAQRRAPQGLAFYEPSAAEVDAGEHGSLIWSREVVSGPTIGGSTRLLLYRSTSAKGETVPVSGVVSVPEGDPPDGGWPVISWGHGTTGMADECAP